MPPLYFKCRAHFFPHTFIRAADLPHRLIRGTHFFEGKITLNPRFVLWLPNGHFIELTWFFKKFPLPSSGHFYTYTVFWASPCHRVVYNPMAGRCPEYRKCVSSCHSVVYKAMAGAAVWVPRLQYTKKNVHVKAKEILRNFKEFRDILRGFQKSIKNLFLPSL